LTGRFPIIMNKIRLIKILHTVAVLFIGILIGLGCGCLCYLPVNKGSSKSNTHTAETSETVISEDDIKADLYAYKGNELLSQGDLHNAVANYEISLQYREDPDVMYLLAENYKDFQKFEGDGCWFTWNFDRAQDLYLEAFSINGDSAPIISFCEMCDAVLLDPVFREGYKVQILENHGIEVEFVLNANLLPGEYKYSPDFSEEGKALVIEGGYIDNYYLENGE